MKALVSADLHFSENKRDAYRFTVVPTLTKLIKQHKVDALIILGDLTEAKDRHSAWLANEVANHLQRLATLCELVIVQGNHDYVAESTPFFGWLEHIPNISWIGEPRQQTVGKLTYLMLPHTRRWQEWTQIDLAADVVLTHNTFAEPDYSDGIPLDIFAAGTLVISGDLHEPHEVTSAGVQLTYVGAPYLIDFGDSYEPRALLLDGKELRSLPLPGAQKRLIEGKDAVANRGDVVRIKLLLQPHEVAGWSELRQQWLQWAEQRGLIVDSIMPVLAQRQALPQRLLAGSKSDEQILAEHCRRHAIDVATAKTGKNLLRVR
jgi:predicted phosphodiesterase